MIDNPFLQTPAQTSAPINHFGERLVLVFQGGGALGSYQAGVYEALAAADARPDWIAGISIGAINAALIAGNAPGRRVAALHEFWHDVSSSFAVRLPLPGDFLKTVFSEASAASALLGIPGFFHPRVPPTYVLPASDPGALGFYDTSPLSRTLERLVDFDRLNDGSIRVSLGAVNVATGNFKYFDTTEQRLGPEHIMASGALPPGFPPVRIGDDWYWDGGLVSNTPLSYVLDQDREDDLCVFQVDLFPAAGPMPDSIFDLPEREKDIRFSSRTRLNTDMVKDKQRERRAMHRLLAKLPPEFADDPDASLLRERSNDSAVTLVHLINRRKPWTRDSKDYEFSRRTVTERWSDGRHDAQTTLGHETFLNRRRPAFGIEVLDLCDAG
ncbi:patatin-like phospholipase family protein [Aurantimonas sp. VKM B-3413]|uniref:patatin-like phospholipase family protein n=1 Tax=Aurantimonas sp. VKM B-3413 TaxID=2779401 RepID=UPI001E5EF9D3|nr:patatin-like phospholipase family protein [Aurantimonas sp. VKM B-3413]MCB8837651.1 patatin-like phospholipase family protein [Aurantimonas sp. VKM B-3413]